MAHADIERLRSIKTFPSLVKYLRDELDWPIESDDVEDLTFEYEAEELGIDPKTAAKIQEIKQLRPMDTKQPWGIFFVKFEPKRLPVVVLRKILNQLVIKKRALAGKSTQATWNLHDLLFISAYGEHEERQITFAHFTQDPAGKELPTLRVLGWDGRDTTLHMDEVVHTLKNTFRWPKTFHPDEVRERWSSAFTYRHREVITTASGLAERLAALASRIRDQVLEVMSYETDKGAIRKLFSSFRAALVHDLEPKDFADMYAQTIAYGLLSSRIADPTKTTLDDFAAHMRTNPFLRELMETFLRIGGRKGKAGGPGIDFDELGVSEVVALLDEANMEAVVRDFGDRNASEDPVIHFYEHFLAAYDKKLKVSRGVFYTPQPVVSYIVRNVHEVLQTEFGLEDGLADTTTWGEMLKKYPGMKLPPLTDEQGENRTISSNEPFVQILDPATGTATFLVEVITVIHQTLLAKWKQQRLTDIQQHREWNDYVPKHLLPRLHAFELMMAPYAIAHMKIGLKLAETGYQFGTVERARIYLTNALEPWLKQPPLINFEALAHEAFAVNEVKQHKRFTVVIGNPPYSNFGQLNKNPYILGLLEDYKRGLDEKKINLDDDFIKFVRFSQATLMGSGIGVLGFITNNVYLEGLTHRKMRQSLMGDFTNLSFVNLHGDQRKKETAPDGSRDENVFDIMQGVAILLASRTPKPEVKSHLEYQDVWGLRDKKYQQLMKNQVAFAEVQARSPNYFFKSIGLSTTNLEEEYLAWWRIADISEGISGIETKRDHFAIDQDRSVLQQRITDFVDGAYTDAARKMKFDLRDNEWVVADAVKHLRKDRSWEKRFVQCLYRPFDPVWIIYHGTILSRDRGELMYGMTKNNLGLVAARQSKEPFAVLATNCVCTHKIVTVYDRSFLFPLYRYPSETGSASRLAGFNERSVNLSFGFIEKVCSIVQLKWTADETGDLKRTIGPEDVFHYAYALFYSPSYRSRYAEFLKIDFPRLPLTANLELFRALIALGGELTALHLLQSPRLNQPITEFIGGRHSEVEKISWSRDTVWIDTAKTTGFRGVREEIWNFHIGGYQVCEKWLKDRKGCSLSKGDLTHYQKTVVALSETIRLMNKIDEVIEAHGGWPGAFSSKP